MSRIAIIAGAALTVLGVAVTVLSDSGSITALIPAIAHHLMHAAGAVSLVPVLGGLGSLIGRGGEGSVLLAQFGIVVICGALLALAVPPFRAARHARSVA